MNYLDFEQQTLCLDLAAQNLDLRFALVGRGVRYVEQSAFQLVEHFGLLEVTDIQRRLPVKTVGPDQVFGFVETSSMSFASAAWATSSRTICERSR